MTDCIIFSQRVFMTLRSACCTFMAFKTYRKRYAPIHAGIYATLKKLLRRIKNRKGNTHRKGRNEFSPAYYKCSARPRSYLQKRSYVIVNIRLNFGNKKYLSRRSKNLRPFRNVSLSLLHGRYCRRQFRHKQKYDSRYVLYSKH